jgi:hypothetical protein
VRENEKDVRKGKEIQRITITKTIGSNFKTNEASKKPLFKPLKIASVLKSNECMHNFKKTILPKLITPHYKGSKGKQNKKETNSLVEISPIYFSVPHIY